jgi:hypothetical protein
MPIELGIWRMDETLKELRPTELAHEIKLEDFLEEDVSLLNQDLLVIGRQVITAYGKQVDLLAIDAEGVLFVIELKRDRTPRDVVAQVLDYASWVQDLSYADITEIYEDYAAKRENELRFEQAFSDRFGSSPPETLNESHRLIIVAAELDPSTERILTYLSEGYGVPVNAVFFQHFDDDGREYLTRTWLRDPKAVGPGGPGEGKKERWNGRDFYVSLGEGEHRNWDDCRKYGFISGGQGRWYSRTLEMLFPSARVFVNIPGTGYVGVGEVTEEAQPVKDFNVEVSGVETPILDLQDELKAPKMGENAEAPEKSEYLVRVEWIKERAREDAIWEKGMFANQNTACKLRNQFTLERLVDRFDLEK